MHGATLKEIEEDSSNTQEHIVDVLGKILFKALVHQFPKGLFTQEILLGSPSTYLHRIVTGIAHVQTVVPMGDDGELDLSLKGVSAFFSNDVPPQSAKPSFLEMTREQHEQVSRLGYKKGDHQDLFSRLSQRVQVRNEKIIALVVSTDMARIEDVVKRNDPGDWQNLLREIMKSQK